MLSAQASRRAVRWALWTLVLAAVGAVAWRNREALQESVGHMARASVPWLFLALGAVAVLYLIRAVIYSIPLALLRHQVPLTFRWWAAVVASAVNQLFPTGGASTYAVLAWAFTRRGVRGGQASLVALLDTLSYAVATATLVMLALVWVGFVGGLQGKALMLGFAPGVALMAVGVWGYWLQRRRERLVRLALRVERRMTSLFRVRSRRRAVLEFLDDYYQGKAVLVRHPGAFLQMVALQYLVVAVDAAILWLTFRALGVPAPVWMVFLGFVVAMAAGMVVNVPAGGGSFEVVMSAFFVQQGVGKADAIAAAMLFRLVSFWVPLAASGVLLLGLWRQENIGAAVRPHAKTA
jgi:uncharacterized protein (TIRG00374 family)